MGWGIKKKAENKIFTIKIGIYKEEIGRLGSLEKKLLKSKYVLEILKRDLIYKSNRCSRLPESIIVELSSHKVLLKTSMKSMNIICNRVDKLVPLNKTYNIVKLNPNCRVITEDCRKQHADENKQI